MTMFFFISVLLIEHILLASTLDFNTTTEDGIQTCNTPGCNKAAMEIWDYMNQNINPCDNFYEFVCNGLSQYPIPDERSSISTLGGSLDRIKGALKDTIELELEENDPETFKKVQSHYNICLDTAQVEQNSIQLLYDVLRDLGDWPVLFGKTWSDSTFDWKKLTYKLRQYGYSNSMNYLINFALELDEKDSEKFVITLDEATTGLDYEYLIEGGGSAEVLYYYKYMVSIAEVLGANWWYAALDLAESLRFEMDLAKISLPIEERRNKSLLYNPMTVGELESKYPDVPWKEYINEFLQPHYTIDSSERVIVRNPNYLKSLSELISKTPKRVIANYAIWRVVLESMPFMNEELRNIRAEFVGYMTGIQVQEPRWEQCLFHLWENMPLAIGALYVKKVFDKNLKKEVTKLVSELFANFKKSLEKVDWMEGNTKKTALKKLEKINAYVAYPEELLDNKKLDSYFEDVKLVPHSYLDSYLSLNLFDLNDVYQQLRIPYNKTEWFARISSAEVNAFYSYPENSIEIAAGYIQEELFVIDQPNYINYGAIGSVIAHELSHAFDDQGSQYNEDGKLVNWWDSKTQKEYQNRAKCLIDQYSNYTVKEIDKPVNGMNTQGENIADNIGIKQAYLAYEEYERQNGEEPRLPNLPYTPRQLFWISAAKVWCEKATPQFLETFVTTNEHAPSEFRVIGSFSNVPEFSRDFNCPDGYPMNPAKKCKFW